MSDLSRIVPNEVVHPLTGEMLDVTDPSACARAIAELRDLEDRIKEVKRALGRTLVEESFRAGSKTLHLPGADVTLTEKVSIIWDLEKLRELRTLGLPEERWQALAKVTVETKVSAAVATQLAGANPEYARIIGEARTDHVGDRYVSEIERSAG